MSQYQSSQYPPPQNSHYPPNSHGQQPYNSHPSQSTFPPNYNQPRMEQPQATYQAQQPMSEKPQPNAQVHDHGHSHAKTGFGNKWLFGLFDCFSPLDTCCLGFWCPCVLFGRTHAREHGEGETSGANGMCFGWYCAACVGFSSCLQCVMRGQQRERHGIEGGTAGDFCAPFCCPCCTLVQEEKESIVRNTGMDPKTKVAYQPINQMNYSA